MLILLLPLNFSVQLQVPEPYGNQCKPRLMVLANQTELREIQSLSKAFLLRRNKTENNRKTQKKKIIIYLEKRHQKKPDKVNKKNLKKITAVENFTSLHSSIQ